MAGCLFETCTSTHLFALEAVSRLSLIALSLLTILVPQIRCHLGRNAVHDHEIAQLSVKLNEVPLRLVTAEAGSVYLETLDKEYLHLNTADMEPQPKVEGGEVPFCCHSTNADVESTKSIVDDASPTVVVTEQTQTLEKGLI